MPTKIYCSAHQVFNMKPMAGFAIDESGNLLAAVLAPDERWCRHHLMGGEKDSDYDRALGAGNWETEWVDEMPEGGPGPRTAFQTLNDNEDARKGTDPPGIRTMSGSSSGGSDVSGGGGREAPRGR